MARISLRAYHREIEDQIENHQYDQAISHCRHILKYYPKNINTYRLLGKAYLESQRYADATDIFQRVLSSVPDDFVSHVGNSIIREDEGNLDEAIWHMERAFESQPANSAIQGELRRLHGRREGVEPPKIRLTRGALARMYLKGELFQQAIAELRAGLQEDSKRYDLQVLLAQAYFACAQRVDAAEVCSRIIKGLPFCLEANRILADILSHSERSEEAKVYASRVQSLDPYAAHISPTALTPDKVPDAAVLLEKLDWRPGIPTTEKPSQPEWASTVGVDLGESTPGNEAIPEWLTTPMEQPAPTPVTSPEPILQQASQPVEPGIPSEDVPIPEWMREAGWVPSSGAAVENISLPLEESKDLSEELAPAEIPDWLKSIAPEQTQDEIPAIGEKAEVNLPEPEESSDTTAVPWLEETPPGPSDSVVTWLEGKGIEPAEETPLAQNVAEQGEVPDWLKDLEPQQVSQPAQAVEPGEVIEKLPEAPIEREDDQANLAGGLAAIGVGALSLGKDEDKTEIITDIPAELGPEIEPEVEEVMPGTISDWLESLGPAAEGEQLEIKTSDSALDAVGSTGTFPDWLQELKTAGETEAGVAETVETPVTTSTSEEESEAVPAEEIPEWMRGLEPASQEPTSANAGTMATLPEAPEDMEAPAAPAEELPEWLKSIEPTTEAETEALERPGETPLEAQFEVTAPAVSQEEISVEAAPPVEPSEWALENVEPEMPAEILPQPDITSPSGAAISEEDEAFAWLEGLAAKQGAEEALLLNPDERRDTPPEWVQKEAESELAPVVPEQLPGMEEVEPSPVEASVESLTDWVPEDVGKPIPEALEPVSVEGDETLGHGVIPEETSALASEPKEIGLAAMAGATAAFIGKHEEVSEAPVAAPESEMLFWPREVPPATEQLQAAPGPIQIEESPILEEDTKPTGVKPIEAAVVGAAIAAGLANQPEEPGVPTEPVSERPETAPIVEEPLVVPDQSELMPAFEAVSEAVPEEAHGEMSFETPGDEELPEWLRGAEDELPLISTEPIEAAPDLSEIPAQEEITSLDDEAAFAWLEGLATRQGADEALLLTPEERTETPPEWVAAAMVAGDLTKSPEQPTEIEAAEELPTWMQEIPPEPEGDVSKAQVEEAIPAWLKQPVTFEDTGAPEISEPTPTVPELPPWLAGAEKPGETEETPSWIPPEEANVSSEVETREGLHAGGTSSEEAPHALDLNEAGLVDLERVPGIGFVKAQAILDYRQEHGRFESIDGLADVPGMTTEEIDGLKGQIQVSSPLTEEEMELPRDDNQVALLQARNALVQGNIPTALSHYQSLIGSSQMLAEVIQDLNEALYRFPVDVDIWQSLGDAHVHSGHLQDALDAYTKAEEYLR